MATSTRLAVRQDPWPGSAQHLHSIANPSSQTSRTLFELVLCTTLRVVLTSRSMQMLLALADSDAPFILLDEGFDQLFVGLQVQAIASRLSSENIFSHFLRKQETIWRCNPSDSIMPLTNKQSDHKQHSNDTSQRRPKSQSFIHAYLIVCWHYFSSKEQHLQISVILVPQLVLLQAQENASHRRIFSTLR